MPHKIRDTDRILIALTSLALNAPSSFTIAWSKEQHTSEMPILYAGIATSGATVVGALLGDKHYGNSIMWGGLAATLGLFGYVTFLYKPAAPAVFKKVDENTFEVKGQRFRIVAD